MPPRITIIDDRADVLSVFVALLTAAGFQVAAIEHQGEMPAELLKKVLGTKPDVLLLDGNLAADVKGIDLVPALKVAFPNTRLYGFSTADSMKEGFIKAGADGFVLKDIYSPASTVKELQELLM
jgi:CheY-like chemotaxis protein